MTSERLRDLWPSLTTDDMIRIVEADNDDPEWMSELSQQERDELRDACGDELEMLESEAKRRSNIGHPVFGDEYRFSEVPGENGGFKRIVESTDSDRDE